MEQKFNGEISQKTAEMIGECNCDNCKWFGTAYMYNREISACRLPGCKSKYYLEDNQQVFQVCNKYEPEE